MRSPRALLGSVGVAVAFVTSTLAVCAHAESNVDAKLQCQVAYGSRSEMGVACKEGVDIGARAAEKNEDAASQCTASRENGARVTACQQGVAFYERFAGRVRSTDKSSFSYSWRQPKTGLQVDVGDYQASVGNQKAVDDCMRAFDGAEAPPSCMSGITVQPKAPEPVPVVPRK
jgi:hypothetical protein